jgi:hypothetical protein
MIVVFNQQKLRLGFLLTGRSKALARGCLFRNGGGEVEIFILEGWWPVPRAVSHASACRLLWGVANESDVRKFAVNLKYRDNLNFIVSQSSVTSLVSLPDGQGALHCDIHSPDYAPWKGYRCSGAVNMTGLFRRIAHSLRGLLFRCCHACLSSCIAGPLHSMAEVAKDRSSILGWASLRSFMKQSMTDFGSARKDLPRCGYHLVLGLDGLSLWVSNLETSYELL